MLAQVLLKHIMTQVTYLHWILDNSGTTDNVTFNNVTVSGTLTSDDITSLLQLVVMLQLQANQLYKVLQLQYSLIH